LDHGRGRGQNLILGLRQRAGFHNYALTIWLADASV
jgi:hypothetical protein